MVYYNVCPVKIRSKHSSNTLLCLLRNFTGQTLELVDKIGKKGGDETHYHLTFMLCMISLFSVL